ncbi:MAG TPA: GntR family transcriptional regulator [Casimicrobiaceae bacterium]|jgi:DNA-binding GntR family transcriptional regulator
MARTSKPAPARRHVAALQRRGNRHGAETASAAVYRILRDEIVWLKRKPGEPIVEKDIALARGVSRTPVREALLRLTTEGLVDTVAKSGTFVARIPASALPEAIVVRKALEQVNARAAAERARRSDIALLRTTLEQQREAEAAGDRAVFHRADEAFHATLAAVAGYPGIWSLIQSVKTQIDRYRLLTLPQPGRMARVIREHAAVVAAVEKHDAERAAAAMDAHLDGLRISVDDIRRMNPDFFYEDIHGTEDLLR